MRRPPLTRKPWSRGEKFRHDNKGDQAGSEAKLGVAIGDSSTVAFCSDPLRVGEALTGVRPTIFVSAATGSGGSAVTSTRRTRAALITSDSKK